MIKEVHGEMSPFQLGRLAAHAIVHHPRRILEYLTDTTALNNFVLNSLCNYPIDSMEPSLICPMLTPYLVGDDTLRFKMDTPENLTDEDLKDIPDYYTTCFYPSAHTEIMQLVNQMTRATLGQSTQSGGAFHDELTRLMTPPPTFDPPEWVDITCIITNPRHSPPVTLPAKTSFDPLQHMGMPANELKALPLDLLRQIAMARLPHVLATITSTPIILSILTALNDTPQQKLHKFLTASTFAHYLGPPNSPDSITYYYYRF